MSDDLPPTLIALALMIPFVAIVVGLWAARRQLQRDANDPLPVNDATPDPTGPLITMKSHRGLDYGSGGGAESGGGDGGGGGGGGD